MNLVKMTAVKEKMRLKAKGFIQNKELSAFLFPSIDPDIIAKALKTKLESSKTRKEPIMRIGPINANGSIGVDFNVDMLTPTFINQRVY